jgi:hypothetical protein
MATRCGEDSFYPVREGGREGMGGLMPAEVPEEF